MFHNPSRIILLLLAIVMSMLLLACGSDTDDSGSTEEPDEDVTPVEVSVEVRPYTEWTITQTGNIYDEMVTVVVDSYAEYQLERGSFRTILLSPDGNTLVGFGGFRQAESELPLDFSDVVCRYQLDDDAVTCAAIELELHEAHFWPETIYTAWSPDGTHIAMNEDLAVSQRESDLWVLDVENLTFTNLTEDNLYGSWTQVVAEQLQLDSLPLWGPAGDLYFLRWYNTGEELKSALYRFQDIQGEPERVLELPGDWRTFSVTSRAQAAMSPDGTRIALLPVTWMEQPNSLGIWMIDLQAQTVTEFLSVADLQVGLPDWLNPAEEFVDGIATLPQQIVWNMDGSGLLVYGNNPSVVQLKAGVINYLSIDVATKTVTPLLDYNQYEDEAALSGSVGSDSNLLPIPADGMLSPDRGTLFYLPSRLSPYEPAIYAVPFTLDRESILVDTITREQSDNLYLLGRNLFELRAQPGANGNAIFGRTLVTLEAQQ